MVLQNIQANAVAVLAYFHIFQLVHPHFRHWIRKKPIVHKNQIGGGEILLILECAELHVDSIYGRETEMQWGNYEDHGKTTQPSGNTYMKM